MFEPFFTTHPRGTGLGLYLAREFCVANGFDLTTARGRIRLPASDSAAVRPPEAQQVEQPDFMDTLPPHESGPGLRGRAVGACGHSSARTPAVLVVDDESDLRDLLTLTLVRMGLDADSAESWRGRAS